MKIVYKFFIVLFFTLLITSCKTKCNHKDQIVNDSRPENAITYQEMASMFHQYDIGQKKVLDKYRLNFTNSEKDSIETISHYFEIDQLRQYLNYIEKLSKDKAIDLTGVKIFSAAYPKNHSDVTKRGRHTLIFMPTATIGKKEKVAFEPLYSEKGKPIVFTEFLNKFSSNQTRQVQRASFLPVLSAPQNLLSSGLNRGEMAPPFE